MGHSRKRIGIDGRPRYTAIYLDTARRERSAGTFATRRDADRAWQLAEAQLTAGRPGTAGRGTTNFQQYVEGTWFPNHVLEPSTRQSYHYILNRHLFPTFGSMRIAEIQPAHVREWVRIQGKIGQSPANIRQAKIVLSAVFTTALNDGIISNHPCKGVKTPTVPVKEYRILAPAEFDRLYAALPSPISRLLVSTLIESGLRWGELSELRVRDLHQASGIVTIARSVVEVNPRFHPDGERFAIKPYPKSRRARRFKLSPQLVTELVAHIEAHQLEPGDLLFSYSFFNAPPRPTLTVVEDPGLTEPNEHGRSYRHGTLSGYGSGKCRCPHCRQAVARYRATRRANGLDSPRSPRTRDTDGHIPAQWFRLTIWQPACTKAKITPAVRLHDLRHSHASWLLAGGADLQVVKERLGHTSIATTERYLHTLPNADDTALAALARVRHQSSPT